MVLLLQPDDITIEAETGLSLQRIHRLSVEQYHVMAEAGILTEDDQVELLDGWLVSKMTKNRRHSLATRAVRLALESLLGPDWYVDAQEPISLEGSEPEPDVMIVRGQAQDYVSHPTAADVALVVEVADTTLRGDRQLKKRLYAQAGIAVYWIINLIDERLEVYMAPTGPGHAPDYLSYQAYGPENLAPVIVEGVEIGHVAVQHLLP